MATTVILLSALLGASSGSNGRAAPPAERQPVALHLGAPLASSLPLVPQAATANPFASMLPPDDGLFTLLDYYDSGQTRAETFVRRRLGTGSADLTGILASRRGACVRVEAFFEMDSGGRSAALASGVLLGQGRVLTAGHVFRDGRPDELRVTFRDGRAVSARVLHVQQPGWDAPEDDWAVLALGEAPPPGIAVPALGETAVGDLALILGYPDRIGLDERGQATHAIGRESSPLDPLLFVTVTGGLSSFDLDPVAGSIPVGGASGAPIFNTRGELVGVLSAVGRLAYPEGVRHSYRMAPTRTFAPFVTAAANGSAAPH